MHSAQVRSPLPLSLTIQCVTFVQGGALLLQAHPPLHHRRRLFKHQTAPGHTVKGLFIARIKSGIDFCSQAWQESVVAPYVNNVLPNAKLTPPAEQVIHDRAANCT
jgi:hypothetical protein